jgi:hypothetical protein
MKLRNLVCTFDQSCRLLELGVAQASQFFFIADRTLIGKEHHLMVHTHDSSKYLLNQNIAVAAEKSTQVASYGLSIATFTDGELDRMLPPFNMIIHREQTLSDPVSPSGDYIVLQLGGSVVAHGEKYKIRDKAVTEPMPTTAQAKAAILIRLLEDQSITLTEVNQRLLND